MEDGDARSVSWDHPNGREREKEEIHPEHLMENLNKLYSQPNIYTHTEHLMENLNKLLS